MAQGSTLVEPHMLYQVDGDLTLLAKYIVSCYLDSFLTILRHAHVSHIYHICLLVYL